MNRFDYLLKIYQLTATSIQADSSDDEAFNKQSLDILVVCVFFQIYSELEAVLSHQCISHLVKKKASIDRFEPALIEQGYCIDSELWKSLLNISKIRNCLVHGNGRLDNDRYGIDTKETIKTINSEANVPLIEILNTLGQGADTTKIKINEPFLYYCVHKINLLVVD